MAGFITVEPRFNEPLYSDVLGITNDFLYPTLGTRGFSRVWRKFSVLAEGRHIFGRRPKPRGFRAGHHSLRSKRFQSSYYCAKVRAGAKKKGGPSPSPVIPFFCSRPYFFDELARKRLLRRLGSP